MRSQHNHDWRLWDGCCCDSFENDDAMHEFERGVAAVASAPEQVSRIARYKFSEAPAAASAAIAGARDGDPSKLSEALAKSLCKMET